MPSLLYQLSLHGLIKCINMEKELQWQWGTEPISSGPEIGPVLLYDGLFHRGVFPGLTWSLTKMIQVILWQHQFSCHLLQFIHSFIYSYDNILWCPVLRRYYLFHQSSFIGPHFLEGSLSSYQETY